MTARRCLAALALIVPSAADADPLALTKTSIVIADQVNTLNPKALPNATLDYAIRVDNPNALLSGQAIGAVVIQDVLPATVVLRVADYGPAGSGPVEFADGNLLGLGLTGSGLRYSFGGLASASDAVDFYDGTSWGYAPIADAEGYDAKVRAIRVRLAGSQSPASAFRLKFRVRLT